MAPLNRKEILQLGLLLLLLMSAGISIAESTNQQGPLSPYFLIEGGDSGTESLPLKKTTTRVKLNGYIAQVEMTQLYRNQGSTPVNASYIFPGSTRAAVNGMTMTIGEHRIVARIKEKQKAKKTFEKARKEGKSTSLLSQKRPNVFSMEVANIMPGDEIEVALTYSETIDAEEGVYEFVYPTVVGPRYGGDAATTKMESQWIANPYFAEGSQDPTEFELSIDMQSPLPINALNGLEVANVIVPDWNDRIAPVRRLMRERGLDVNIGFRSSDPGALSDVIRDSDMVFPASGYLRPEDLRGLRAFAVAVDEQVLSYPVYGYFHQKHRRNPLLHWLLGLIEEGLERPVDL